MKPDITIVIEWENVILADSARSVRMIERLRKQISELGKKVEVIVLFNPEQIDGTFLEKEFFSRFDPDPANNSFSLRIQEVIGKHYYELKNEGAGLAGAIS